MKAVMIVALLLTLVASLSGITTQDILNGKDVIGYQYNRNLYIMDISTKQELPLVANNEVEDFCWDYTGDRIYYLTFNQSTKLLAGWVLDVPSLRTTRLFERRIKPITGYESESLEMLKASISLNVYWGIVVELGFGQCYETNRLSYCLNLSTGKLRLIDWLGDIPFEEGTNSARISVAGGDSTRFISRTAEKHKELYVAEKQAASSGPDEENFIRLSHTQDIDRDPTFTDGDFEYDLSPNRNLVIFGFETFSGDLMHGKTLAVDIDGTHQQILNESCVLNNDFQYGWTSAGEIVYLTDTSDPDDFDAPDDSYFVTINLRDSTGTISTLRQFVNKPLSMEYRVIRPTMAHQETSPQKTFAGLQIFSVKYDGMRLRQSPGLNGPVLETVSLNEEVVYLGETSARADTVTLRNVKHDSHWYKVQTLNGATGWIFGAAIGK